MLMVFFEIGLTPLREKVLSFVVVLSCLSRVLKLH